MRKCALLPAVAVLVGRLASAEEPLPAGQIIDDVQSRADASQHYSLYLPSNFTPERKWPVILVFDAGGRGRRGVERYQAGAEAYGYIVAGSNNARNGPWEVSTDAARAMHADVASRFALDSKRLYTAGMSGGARVAMMLALTPELVTGTRGSKVAGVLASSAGFPPYDAHESVGFPIFASAGTDDFNHYEMMALDRDVKTPHRVEVFEGGHTWLPAEMATEGIEWMEIQAVQSGLRPRDPSLIDSIFAKRMALAERQQGAFEKARELRSIAVDFAGLKDVATIGERAAALERQPDAKKGLTAARAEEERERQAAAEIYRLLDGVASGGGMASLTMRVTRLLEQSKAPEDSGDRRIARRVLGSLSASARDIRDPEFQALLNQIRPPASQGGPQ